MITYRYPNDPNAPTQGNADKPLDIDDYVFGPLVEEVHWLTGAVVIVEVTAVEIKPYQVVVTNPVEWFDDNFGGTEIHEDDYKEGFVFNLGIGFGIGVQVVVEDQLTDIWIWDGFFIGALGDEPFNGNQVNSGTAGFGYSPPIHLTGQQVAYDTSHFGRPFLGDYVTHTHPNGSSTVYANGYTALGSAYVAWHGDSEDFTGVVIRPSDPHGFPEPPADLSGTEAWYWYRVVTRAEQRASVIRRSFLVNFRKDFSIEAELQDFAMALDYSTEWSIKGYSVGTAFTIADGRATPIGDVAPKFSSSGSVDGNHTGTIQRFTGSGFVT